MMASIAGEDFFSLAEEKFDFEVSLSPESSKGDGDIEDEVFLGSVTHNERCISHGMVTEMKDSVIEDNFDQICREAHLLASHLERTISEPVERNLTAASNWAEDAEQFEMDSSAKLVMFKSADALSPIKRDTFCVQGSPMKQLPPAIWKHMQKPSNISAGKPRLSTSSPLRTTNTNPKLATRGKGIVHSGGVLPNKPTTRVNTQFSSGARLAGLNKNRLPPPSKSCFGMKQSPGSRDRSRTGSAEDLLSDTTSIASDVSDSSFNTSLPVKRGLPVASKAELRGGASLCKVPALPNRKVVNRSRNTSSSSSSLSSINSSLSVSPTGKCKPTSSLNTSVSNINRRIPSNCSKLRSSNCKSGILSKPLESSAGRTASLSTHVRKGSEPIPRLNKATHLGKSEARPSVQHQTPTKRTMERTTSVPSIPTLAAKTGSAVKVNSSLKASVAPTSTNALKSVQSSEVTSSPDFPRIVKPKRLITACSVDSVPQRIAPPTPHGLLTLSSATEKPLQSKMRCPSALPTPVSRRVSGIPMLTPKCVPRLNKASCTPELQSPASGISHASPGQLKQSEQQQVVEKEVSKEDSSALLAEFKPCSLVFSLEDDFEKQAVCQPAAVKSSKPSPVDIEPHPPNPECPFFTMSEEILHSPLLKKTEIQEVLLVDAPVPVLMAEEKVLIDLSNTPDLTKTIPKKAFGGQLIDLSSPLIKWSPEEKTENPVKESPPLINLSF